MSEPPRRLWIDTDIVFNRPFADVDDGLALLVALQQPGWRVQGISLNQRVLNGERVTQKLLSYYGRYSIPVYKGVNDLRDGFGQTTDATTPLVDALRAGPLTIVAIGALTNVATVLHRHPELVGRVEDVVCCAGRQRGQSFFAPDSRVALPDANFDNDVASFEAVLASGAPVTLAGFDASRGVVITRADIARIARNGRPGDAWVARRLRVWARLWRVLLGMDGFIPFDACTIGSVFYPDLFRRHRAIPVAVRAGENDARHWSRLAHWSRATHKSYLEVSHDFAAERRVDYVFAPDPSYKDVLMATLLGTVP